MVGAEEEREGKCKYEEEEKENKNKTRSNLINTVEIFEERLTRTRRRRTRKKKSRLEGVLAKFENLEGMRERERERETEFGGSELY